MPTPGQRECLTRREKQIIGQFTQTPDLQKTADALFLSKRTVEWHVANILAKTKTPNLFGAILSLGIWTPTSALWFGHGVTGAKDAQDHAPELLSTDTSAPSDAH